MSVDKYNRRKYNRRYRYDMRQDEFDWKVLNQNFRCPICTDQLTHETGTVDHDHKTGDNRGVLCSNCNSGIGQLRDDIDSVDRAVDYLKSYDNV